MGLAGLDAALSGLRISQQQISLISNNIANVGTPGYSRKILPQSTLDVQGVTIGVRAETIIRKVDINLERDLWTQISATSFYDVQESYLNRIEQFHGAPDQEISVAAEIARLKDAFSVLLDAPEDSFLLSTAVGQAVDTASKFNDLSRLINTLRNDAQDELESTVQNVNNLLQQIADVNRQIRDKKNQGLTTAQLEDTRDQTISSLSELIDISFFTRGDGVLVVQTNRGVVLADENVTPLTFDPGPLSAISAYPASAAGLYVGDPDINPYAVDITSLSPGGKIGGLLTLRDVTFPKQSAQLDELAHKTALRFEEQGLRLFTDGTGVIPADTPPDPAAGPPPVSVAYVGFSSVIQVNQAIIADNTLLQRGTAPTDLAVQSGSNEVLRRVLEFSFGTVNYQQASGTSDVRAVFNGAADLQNWLGVFSDNTITGTRNLGLVNYADIADLVASANMLLDDPADQFQITFEESRAIPPLGPTTITIDLSDAAANFPIGGPIVDGLDQIIAEINNQITLGGVPAGLAATAQRGPNGEITINSRGNMTVDASGFGPTGMGQTGLNFLGLAEATYTTKDPYLDIQVGNQAPVRIFIEPGDDETILFDKLELAAGGGDLVGVAGLGVDIDAATGFLTIRPGDSTDPALAAFGGDLRITSGSFQTDGTGGVPGLPAGVSLVSALFGSYSLGPPLEDVSPLTDVGYGSQVSVSDATLVPFRTQFLGPGANISTGIISGSTIVDFAQKMINEHAQEIIRVRNHAADEKSLRDVLQTQLFDDSGVNLDEELSNMIVVQTAFAASARVITAISEMFDQLLLAVR